MVITVLWILTTYPTKMGRLRVNLLFSLFFYIIYPNLMRRKAEIGATNPDNHGVNSRSPSSLLEIKLNQGLGLLDAYTCIPRPLPDLVRTLHIIITGLAAPTPPQSKAQCALWVSSVGYRRIPMINHFFNP